MAHSMDKSDDHLLTSSDRQTVPNHTLRATAYKQGIRAVQSRSLLKTLTIANQQARMGSGKGSNLRVVASC